MSKINNSNVKASAICRTECTDVVTGLTRSNALRRIQLQLPIRIAKRCRSVPPYYTEKPESPSALPPRRCRLQCTIVCTGAVRQAVPHAARPGPLRLGGVSGNKRYKGGSGTAQRLSREGVWRRASGASRAPLRLRLRLRPAAALTAATPENTWDDTHLWPQTPRAGSAVRRNHRHRHRHRRYCCCCPASRHTDSRNDRQPNQSSPPLLRLHRRRPPTADR